MNNIFIFLIFIIFLSSCSLFGNKNNEQTDDSIVKKKKQTTVNTRDRALSEGSGILFGKGNKDNLGKQNVMWMATLKTLEFIPLNNADYNGGIITTDWYSPKLSNESIKFSVSFNSDEIKASSIEVKSFKRKCDERQNCKIIKMDSEFNRKIKDQILQEVRNIQNQG